MRLLVASTRGLGHFGPLIPLARASVAAGHDVVVSAPWAAATVVEDSGLRFRPFANPPEEETNRVFAGAMRHQRAAATDPDAREAADRIVVGQIFARLNVLAALETMRETFEEFRPHVVLRSPRSSHRC